MVCRWGAISHRLLPPAAGRAHVCRGSYPLSGDHSSPLSDAARLRFGCLAERCISCPAWEADRGGVALCPPDPRLGERPPMASEPAACCEQGRLSEDDLACGRHTRVGWLDLALWQRRTCTPARILARKG